MQGIEILLKFYTIYRLNNLFEQFIV